MSAFKSSPDTRYSDCLWWIDDHLSLFVNRSKQKKGLGKVRSISSKYRFMFRHGSKDKAFILETGNSWVAVRASQCDMKYMSKHIKNNKKLASDHSNLAGMFPQMNSTSENTNSLFA